MVHPASYLVEITAISGALLISQTTFPGSAWIDLVERLGLAVVLVLFFVWTSWKRECRMGERIDFLDQSIVKLSQELSKLTEKVTDTMDHETLAVDHAMSVLAGRPCFAFKTLAEFAAWQATRKKDDGTG